MNNKITLDEIEERYYKLLKEKVYSVDNVNKSKADEELYYIHQNKSSFQFYLAYLMTRYTETTKGYKSFVTYNRLDFCFSYLTNLLNMTPFNIEIDEEECKKTNPYSKIPPQKYSDSHSLMFETNHLTLNVDIYYYCNYKSFLLEYIDGYADIYVVSTDSNKNNNEFVLVPKGYEVDTTKPYDFMRCHKGLKEGEIYLKIIYDTYTPSILREFNRKLGQINIIDSINHYINNVKELLYPRLVEELNDNTINNNAYLFNRCLCDFVIRKQILENANIGCPQRFIFTDDVIQKFIENGYSLKESYSKAKQIEKRSIDYVIIGNTFDDVTNLENITTDTEYADIKHAIFLMSYDIYAIEFFFELMVNEYRDRYGEKAKEIENEFKEMFTRLKALGNDNCDCCYIYTKKEIKVYEKKQ